MSWLLVAPILVPFAAGIIAALAPDRRHRAGASIAGAALLTLVGLGLLDATAGGPIAAQMGDWPVPFGITLVADTFSAVMVTVAGIVGLAGAIYAIVDIDPARERFRFHALLQLLLGGVGGAFVAGDLFNLYVWFEVLLIASFALLVLGGERAQIDGAMKYVALNLISTVLLLASIGLLYGLTGTLNLADLHQRLPAVGNQGAVGAIAMMMLVALGIKAAVFPLFAWLPASYHTPPVVIMAVFSGLLTKVGVYALIRLFTLVFPAGTGFTHDLLLVIAVATMVTGVLGAAAHYDIRRILAFHIVSQIGFLILGLALYTPLALAGAVFYTVHNIVAKANLFLVGGVVGRMTGDFALGRIGGLYRAAPLIALLFLIPALALAGLPPLSGFWAKLMLIQAGLELEDWLVVVAMSVTGLLTLYSMTKIWALGFWEPLPADAPPLRPLERGWPLLVPIVGLASISVGLGLFPAAPIEIAERAAVELLDPSGYLAAVAGGTDVAATSVGAP